MPRSRSVKLTFNNQAAVNFSSVARAPENTAANGVLLNYKLSELMPFNGGDVEIAAGLLALKGASDLRFAVNLLASFSSLVAPPLGQAIAIADKVSGGIESLINDTHGDSPAVPSGFCQRGRWRGQRSSAGLLCRAAGKRTDVQDRSAFDSR